jgi:hypothetical protein
MEISGKLHSPPALPPGKSPWFPLDRRLGGPQIQSWILWRGENVLPGIKQHSLVVQLVGWSNTNLSWFDTTMYVNNKLCERKIVYCYWVMRWENSTHTNKCNKLHRQNFFLIICKLQLVLNFSLKYFTWNKVNAIVSFTYKLGSGAHFTSEFWKN